MFIQYKKATNEVTGFQTFPEDNCYLFAGIPDGAEPTEERAVAEIPGENEEALRVAESDGITLQFIDGQLQ